MKTYQAKRLINHDGVEYDQGKEIPVNETQAKQLLAVGAIELMEESETQGSVEDPLGNAGEVGKKSKKDK